MTILLGVPVHFSLIFKDLNNIHTAKISGYMVIEHCQSNHLVPIIAL